MQEVNVRIKFIEYSRPSAEETIDEQGQTDLHRAVKDNDIALVRELISDDRNVNAQDKYDWTPLHIATHENHIEVAILLLQHPKIDVTLKTKDSTTPLFYALRSNNDNCEELWDLFVKVGGDVTDRGKQGTVGLTLLFLHWNVFSSLGSLNIDSTTRSYYAFEHSRHQMAD